MPALPGVLRANARACERMAVIMREAAETLGERDRRRRLAAAFEHEAVLCRDESLPLFWVSSAMAQVALDASHDLPELSPAMAPTLCGFLAVEGGLPPLPPVDPEGWVSTTGEVSTEGIVPMGLLWETTRTHFRMTIYTHESRMPRGLRLSQGPLQELVALSVPRAHDDTWPPIETVEATPRAEGDAGALRLGGGYLSVMAWACATWHLMMMPTLAERRALDPRTGAEPRPGGDTPEREVTHIDLRPLRHAPTETETETETEDSDGHGRVHTHRWVVRGHWVQQPHGRGGALRRLQWRESYIKGPADAPLLRSRPVNVWRR